MILNENLGTEIIAVNASTVDFEKGVERLTERVNDWFDESENSIEYIIDTEFRLEKVGSVNESTIILTYKILFKKR